MTDKLMNNKQSLVDRLHDGKDNPLKFWICTWGCPLV